MTTDAKVDEQRDQIDSRLRQGPSPRRQLGEYLAYADPKARRSAAHERGRPQDSFPEHCSCGEQEMLDLELSPGSDP